MKINEPKCPKCEETKFAYKRVPAVSKIKNLVMQVSVNKEKMENAREQDKNRYKSHLSSYSKQLYDVFDKPTGDGGEAFIIFCVNCGEIIGTGGGI